MSIDRFSSDYFRFLLFAKSGSAFGDLSGSIDAYTYNARSELTSARRTKDGQPIPGFSEDFDYDPIGNRRSSATYNEKGEAQTSTYQANNLNQYTSRTTPGYAAVRGEADPSATVTVNENPTFRLGSYYFGSDLFDNTAAGGFANLETYATLAQTAANGEEPEDLVSATTNQVYLAQSPETFAYDDDGNQTLITTKTGLWRVTYNGENRPILWVRDSDNTTLAMAYDHMGRRRQKNTQHFFYDGYLQIANFHSPTQTHNTNYFIWEPTELIVTRPLVWGKAAPDDVEYYMHDGNKNVACVIYGQDIIAVAACYEYTSFGEILSHEGALAVENPFRFSSEFCDDDVCLAYYNYRHCDSICGRWICRDRYCEMPTVSFNDEVSSWLSLDYGSSLNLYKCGNDLIGFVDVYGLIAAPPNNPKPEEQNVFQKFDPVDSDVGALQRLIAAEVPLPGVWKQKNISKEEAERNVNALLWCLCNRQRMHALGKWKSVVSEVEDGVVQWKHFDKYPKSYNKFVRRRIAEFQRLAEKGHNKVKGFAMYYDFWQLIRDKVKNLDCETQKSGFEDLDVFKQNYKKECSVCYMRTAGAGNSVGGSVTLGTVGNNTFTIKNVERR